MISHRDIRDLIAAWNRRAHPKPEGEAMREKVHAWLREDTPLAVKMNITPEAVTKLISRLSLTEKG